MAHPVDPCEYFAGDIYIKDQKIYREYISKIEKLSTQERKERINITNIVLEDINEAYKLPLTILGFLGTIIGFFLKILESNQLFYLVMTVYFAVAAVIMLLQVLKIAKKRNSYGLYRTALLDIMGCEGELKTKFEGHSTLSLGTLDCRIVKEDSTKHLLK